MSEPVSEPVSEPGSQAALSAEDAKLLTLARAARTRARAPQGAAVRDLDGRTYAAGTVDLPSLRLSAVQVCVAMAVTSGARGLEAVVVLGGLDGSGGLSGSDAAAITELGGGGVVLHVR